MCGGECKTPCPTGQEYDQECICKCSEIKFNGEDVSGSWDEESSKCLYEVTCYQCTECPTGRTRKLEKSQIDGKSCSSFTNADTGQKYVDDCGSCKWSCVNQNECEPQTEGSYDNQTACVDACGASSSSSTPPSSCSSYDSCGPDGRCCNGVCTSGNAQCTCWMCDNGGCFAYPLPTGYAFCSDFGMAASEPECMAGVPSEGIEPCNNPPPPSHWEFDKCVNGEPTCKPAGPDGLYVSEDECIRESTVIGACEECVTCLEFPEPPRRIFPGSDRRRRRTMIHPETIP